MRRVVVPRSLLPLALVVVGGVVSACSDQPTEPTQNAPHEFVAFDRVDELVSLTDGTTLARALATALEDRDLLRQIFEDLRDSPFRNHAIQVSSYLRGERGGLLLEAMSRVIGTTPGRLRSQLARDEGLAIVVPRAEDRLSWAGSSDILVLDASTAAAARATGASLGFAPGGDPITFSGPKAAVTAHIVIGRSSVRFGPDAEAARANARKRDRRTISTPEEEFRLQGEECTPEMIYCPDPDDSPNPIVGGIDLGPGYGWFDCYGSSGVPGDGDGDGLKDECERAIAEAFAPQLHLQWMDFAPSREPYWAVAPLDPSWYKVRIFYALAYHRDAGGLLTGHYGDSEFVIVDAKYASGKWVFTQMFLSAHWGHWFNSSGWYSHTEVEYESTGRGRPIVWVALDKHANYESRSHCNSGQFWTDDCSGDYYGELAEVLPSANLGRLTNMLVNCVPSRTSTYLYPGTECFWGFDDFKGWHLATSGAGTYRNSLTHFMPG